MAVICPHCGHTSQLKGAKPGRYSPTCPKCSQKFQLVVPADPNAAPQVSKLDSAPPPSPARNVAPPAADINATGAFESAGDPSATGAFAAAADVNATGDFSPPQPDPNSTGAFGGDINSTGAFAESNVNATAAHGQDATHAAPAVVADKTQGGAAGATRVERTTTSGKLDMPEQLGGYKIERELGAGGMGAVYLGRQVSLDRPVAVKVMKPQWARDPVFVSRFTREAYAAAQLVHHNVVQIYDIGEERDIHYFGMEFVEGQSLNDLLRKDGKLDAASAAGYVLQAARGLKFAHEQGMVHRDIKPDNLMLNKHGVVKVADLGLVKTPEAVAEEAQAERSANAAGKPASQSLLASTAGVTLAGAAMGTPTFMAPEQAQDAAKVDQRADVYSLGCTLFALLTGRPLFEGQTAMEVITKHRSAPIVPPDTVVTGLPKELSDIVVKMVAKKPADRFQSMDEVIATLETFLGLRTATGATRNPQEEHLAALETAAKDFRSVRPAKLRKSIAWAFEGGCFVLFLLSALFGWGFVAAGFLGLGVLTPLAYLVIQGSALRSPLLTRLRQYLLGASLLDWAMALVGGVAILLVLYFTGLLWAWLGFLVLAIGFAFGFYAMFDRAAVQQRQPALAQLDGVLKRLRLAGQDEDAVREFVCKYSGEQWEELYEGLFGYEAKLVARDKWGTGQRGTPRPKFAAWRDPVLRWLDAKLAARQLAKERKHLQRVEEKGLQAAGLSAEEAKKQAAETAQQEVVKAVKTKYRRQSAEIEIEQRTDWLGLLAGARIRFLLGAALLATGVIWLNQQQLLPGAELKQLATDVSGQSPSGEAVSAATEQAQALAKGWLERLNKAQPWPGPLALFGSANAALGGLVLVFLSLFHGAKMSVFALPAAAVMIVGGLFLPPLGPIPAAAAPAVVGLGLAGAGFLLGRST